MKPVPSTLAAVVLGLVGLLVTACGGNASLSPLAPSPASDVATISGMVRGGLVNGGLPAAQDAFTTAKTGGVTVSVVGTGISTTADTQGQFTLTNVPSGTVQLNFTGAGANATVTVSGVGANDRVQIEVTLNGNRAHIDSEHHNNGEISARIASIDGGNKTFRAGDWTIKVTDSTVIRHGSTKLQFSDLKVGDHVQVRGSRDGSMVTATEIKVEHAGDAEDEDDNDQGDHEAELEGVVSGLSDSCPGITFTVQSTKVKADQNTTYGSTTSCGAIKNDLKVEVKGIKQSDGSVLARRISIDD